MHMHIPTMNVTQTQTNSSKSLRVTEVALKSNWTMNIV